MEDKLGKSSTKAADLCANIGFQNSFVCIKSQPELAFPLLTDHPKTGIMSNFINQGNLLFMGNVISHEQMHDDLAYGCHGSAACETTFSHPN